MLGFRVGADYAGSMHAEWPCASRTTILRETPSVRVRAYRQRGERFGEPIRKAARWHSLLLVRSGRFEKRVGGRRHVADPNWAVFFNRDEPYEILAPSPFDDSVTELEIRPSILAGLAVDSGSRTPDPEARPFDAPTCIVESPLHRLHVELWRTCRQPAADALAIEESALHLAAAVVERASARTARERRDAAGVRPATRRAHAELARAAMAFLGDTYRDAPTLERIAAGVDTSPWHLCRVFRRETGLSIHRYLERLRLREALASLLESDVDLTRLALRLGYSSHSHFTAAFRREFGVTPSAARRAAPRPLGAR